MSILFIDDVLIPLKISPALSIWQAVFLYCTRKTHGKSKEIVHKYAAYTCCKSSQISFKRAKIL